MDKIFSILKSKCNTRQQRLAFNQLIKSFVEYQSLDDMWDSIFKNGEFKGNTKSKGGTVQGKHMSIYIKFKGDKGAYQVVDNSNGSVISQGKVDRSGKKEPLNQPTKESSKSKENTGVSKTYRGNKDLDKEIKDDLSYKHSLELSDDPEVLEVLKRISEFLKDENGKVDLKDIVEFDDPTNSDYTEALTMDNYDKFLNEEPASISDEIPLGSTGSVDHGKVRIITTKNGNRLIDWTDVGGLHVIHALDPNKKETTKQNEDQGSDAVIKIDTRNFEAPSWSMFSPDFSRQEDILYTQADEIQEEDPNYAKQLYEAAESAHIIDNTLEDELGEYTIWNPEDSDIPSNIVDKLYGIADGKIKDNVNKIGNQNWVNSGVIETKLRDNGTSDGGYKIIDIGGVKIAELQSAVGYGSSSLTSWAVPKKYAKKLYKYLESLK